MEPVGPERRNHKLLRRSSHCQIKVLPRRPMTRKQWKHKPNKALKDLFQTVLSQGTIRQKQMTIKLGLMKMRFTGYLLCTDHNPCGCAACRVLETLYRQCLFLTAQCAKASKSFNHGPHLLAEATQAGSLSCTLLQAIDCHPAEQMTWT